MTQIENMDTQMIGLSEINVIIKMTNIIKLESSQTGIESYIEREE